MVALACAPDAPPDSPTGLDAFWSHLEAECGRAYEGRLGLEPPGDEMLTGTELLVAHFRECGEDELRIPFHIEIEDTGEWDRSRTWVLLREPGALELRHDHRRPDGEPDEHTWYGGMVMEGGTATRQDFLSAERTEEAGYLRGWRIEILPGQRYSYGTTRRGEWSWRVDFDLSRPVDPPPPPWGFEDAG
jgi:hypothetical protein